MCDHKETDSKKQLSADDVELWRAVTQDVELIKGREYVEPQKAPSKPQKTEATTPQVIPEQILPKRQMKGIDVDRNTMRRLKRGDMRPEGRLDLHGMNQGVARQALIAFIVQAQSAGKRCVLVVTGKGNTGRQSKDWMTRNPGVLKQNVPMWLRESELGPIVLQVVTAQPKDGGDGALYVYLRRNR